MGVIRLRGPEIEGDLCNLAREKGGREGSQVQEYSNRSLKIVLMCEINSHVTYTTIFSLLTVL